MTSKSREKAIAPRFFNDLDKESESSPVSFEEIEAYLRDTRKSASQKWETDSDFEFHNVQSCSLVFRPKWIYVVASQATTAIMPAAASCPLRHPKGKLLRMSFALTWRILRWYQMLSCRWNDSLPQNSTHHILVRKLGQNNKSWRSEKWGNSKSIQAAMAF